VAPNVGDATDPCGLRRGLQVRQVRLALIAEDPDVEHPAGFPFLSVVANDAGEQFLEAERYADGLFDEVLEAGFAETDSNGADLPARGVQAVEHAAGAEARRRDVAQQR